MGFFELFSAALTGFYAVIPSYGLAIILLTVLVRVLMLPLSIKQTRSMREMQRIQPEVKKLQSKYKGDRQKMNQEVMKLYQEHKVNPLGGCLPLVAQFPVLLALFRVIRTPLKYMGYMAPKGAGRIVALTEYVPGKVSGPVAALQHSRLADNLLHAGLKTNHFLGLRLDCSPSQVLRKAPSGTLAVSCGHGFVSALPYLVLVLAMGFTTYYQQRQTRSIQGQQAPQAQQMQTVMRIMPVMLMVFAFNFPAGIVFYWMTTNGWTIGQQRLMLRVAPMTSNSEGADGNESTPQERKGESKGHANRKRKRKKKRR